MVGLVVDDDGAIILLTLLAPPCAPLFEESGLLVTFIMAAVFYDVNGCGPSASVVEVVASAFDRRLSAPWLSSPSQKFTPPPRGVLDFDFSRCCSFRYKSASSSSCFALFIRSFCEF